MSTNDTADERGGAANSPNSDTMVEQPPFAFRLISFLWSYYKINEKNARMLLHQARAYDEKESEALRWACVVQQAENFLWNQNHEYKGHWAVWKADSYLTRVYEQWPDINMHERMCKAKAALGGVATFFQYLGTITEAHLALNEFIRTGIVPPPKPIKPETIAAAKKADAAKRSAAFEAAIKEQTVTITDKEDLDKVFPRNNGQPVEDKAVTDTPAVKTLGDYNTTQSAWGSWWTAVKNICADHGVPEDEREDKVHEILLGPDWQGRSVKEFQGTGGDAIGTVRDHFEKRKKPKAEKAANKPAVAPEANTEAAQPAKQDKPAAAQKPHSSNGINPFQKASKKNSKLRMAFGGVPGGGKTYTALQTATELFPNGKIALIDTEAGSAEKYADLFDFDVLPMQKDYSPERYIELIHAAENNGYDLLIIDSFSHEWDGTGGVLDLVDGIRHRNPGDSWAAWREMTPRHNAVIAAILESKIHIIVTMRCKWKNVIEKIEAPGAKVQKVNKKVVGSLVQREKIEYEFDIVALLDEFQNVKIDKSRCPALTDFAGRRCGKEIAGKIIDWLSVAA